MSRSSLLVGDESREPEARIAGGCSDLAAAMGCKPVLDREVVGGNRSKSGILVLKQFLECFWNDLALPIEIRHWNRSEHNLCFAFGGEGLQVMLFCTPVHPSSWLEQAQEVAVGLGKRGHLALVLAGLAVITSVPSVQKFQNVCPYSSAGSSSWGRQMGRVLSYLEN